MEIKKGYRFVCTEDVIMEGSRQVNYVKGDVYTSEQDGCITNMLGERAHSWTNPECQNFFIPYYQLDKVYTKHTPLLEKIFEKYEGKKSATWGKDIRFFDNVANSETGWFVSTSNITEENYKDDDFIYLSEQAFIEFMDLGKYIGSLNVERNGFTEDELEIVSEVIDNCIYGEEASYSFPTDWYLDLDNPEVDINIIKDFLRSLDGVNSNFITDVQGCLLGQDIMGDGSYQHWGSDKQFIEKKYKLVEIYYQDFLDNVYRKKEVVGDTSQPKHEEEVPDYLKIAEEWSKHEDSQPKCGEDMVNGFKDITDSIAELLQYKNDKYGNSALEPLEIFGGKCKVGTRLDDKLARIKNSESLKKNDVADLIGYCVLICKENDWKDFSEFMD